MVRSLSREQAFFLTTVAAGATIWVIRSRLSVRNFLISDLINPQSVSHIAAQLDQSNDAEFILDAWDFVGSHIPYMGYGSELFFTNHHIRCQKCLLPTETLKNMQANCVGKSALLASLLRNRLPAERVYMVIGELADGDVGGHSWVEAKLDSEWYLLESTRPPRNNPWVRAAAMTKSYTAMSYLNDQTLSCFSEEFCVSIPAGSCDCLTSPYEED